MNKNKSGFLWLPNTFTQPLSGGSCDCKASQGKSWWVREHHLLILNIYSIATFIQSNTVASLTLSLPSLS